MRRAEFCSDPAEEYQRNNNHFSSNAPSGLNWPYLILRIEANGLSQKIEHSRISETHGIALSTLNMAQNKQC